MGDSILNMAKEEAVFEFRNVGFAYSAGEPLLRGLNLRIGAGERVCVLGANGCGKSTLLRMMAGLLFPQSGEFRAFGIPVKEKSLTGPAARAYHRRVGFVFQNTDAQLFCSTVREELAFGPLQTGLPPDEVERRVEETADLLGIRRLLPRPPYHLSGGERKKVAVAGVLILSPEVLILDEPTNDLDPRSQRWLLDVLRGLAQAGRTLIFATHNLELVPAIADRALLFAEDHTLAADRPVGELLRETERLKQVNLVDEEYRPPAGI